MIKYANTYAKQYYKGMKNIKTKTYLIDLKYER